MADIAIKLGVNAPEEELNRVLTLLEYVYDQPQLEDVKPLTFTAFESDFSDGAIGVLASMSFILNYKDYSGTDKIYSSHLLESFERNIQENKPVVTFKISPNARKLIRIVYMQRDLERNDSERSDFVQKKAEELGIIQNGISS